MSRLKYDSLARCNDGTHGRFGRGLKIVLPDSDILILRSRLGRKFHGTCKVTPVRGGFAHASEEHMLLVETSRFKLEFHA